MAVVSAMGGSLARESLLVITADDGSVGEVGEVAEVVPFEAPFVATSACAALAPSPTPLRESFKGAS